jgi:SagB-type dehydrogenase family enzyme
MSTMWVPVTTAASAGTDKAEIDSPVTGARVRVHRDALASLLAGRPVPAEFLAELRQCGLLMGGEDADEHQGQFPAATDLSRWQERGWGLSLSYYLWSRRSHFLDNGPDSVRIRTAALTDMEAQEKCPTPVAASSGDWVDIAVCSEANRMRSLGETLVQRKSLFKPSGGTLRRADLALLLEKGTVRFRDSRRITDGNGPIGRLLVSFGSAIDIYVIVYRSPDMANGIYLLNPISDQLFLTREGDFLGEAREALLAHPDPQLAAATIVLVGDFPRYQWRYRHERALRNLWIDAGRIMQDILLSATALDMETGITPAVADSRFAPLLELTAGDCQVLHTLTVSGRHERD